jgi:Amt family ammonium transporter
VTNSFLFNRFVVFLVIVFDCRIDDALDVSSVHGVTGVIGSLAIGFCAQKSLNPDGS